MKYDLALFEQLNEEYRDRPIHDVAKIRERRKLLSSDSPLPRTVGQKVVIPADRTRYAATTQLKPILKDVDLCGKVVLELGCAHGWLTSVLPEHAGASRAIGVDVQRHSSWKEHTDPRVSLIEADLSQESVVAPRSVDSIISNATFEHVAQPVQMLAAMHDILADGGEAWLRMNVYTARNASHRYTEVFFPWPHLLFDDDICARFYLKHYRRSSQRFAWVNRMTVAHYLQIVRDVGFEIMLVRRRVTPIDIPFYVRFVDRLGRYAALDLETDFLTLVLRKSTERSVNGTAPPLDVDYIARQRALDQETLRFLATDQYADDQNNQAAAIS